MVIKTDTCYYTEMKVYPGWGIRVVRKDGKLQPATWDEAFAAIKAKSAVSTVRKLRPSPVIRPIARPWYR